MEDESPSELSKELSRATAIIAHIDASLKNGSLVASSTIDAKVKAAIADLESRPNMDATGMREQTLANIGVVYDLFELRSKHKLSLPKVVITLDDVEETYCAAVVRTKLDGQERLLPEVTIQVEGCESALAALRELHRFSASLLREACCMFEHYGAKLDFWNQYPGHHYGGEGYVMGGGLT